MAEMIRSEESDSSGTNESRGGHFAGEVRDKQPSQPSSRKRQSTQGNESHKACRRTVKAASSSDNDSSGSESCDVRGKQSSHSSSRKQQSLYAKKSSKSHRRRDEVSTSSDSDSSSGDEVKAALESHYSYLRKNLRVDNELAAKLYGWSPQLLGDPPYGEIRSMNNQGKQYDAFEKWFNFATSSYTQESVGEFCKCLKEAGREDRPRLTKVARKTLKKVPNRVKAALERHHSYLRKNLRVDNELAAKLYGWIPKLLKST